MYVPCSSSDSVSAAVLTLVDAARRDSLVLCVGAGLSMAEDACLPSGKDLGVRLDQRLDGRLTGYSQPDDVENLIAVADAAVVPIGGETALRTEVLELAQFTSAPANYGHQVLALLLAEGALTVLSWNWDTCIERAGPPDETLDVARTRNDMADLALPQLAKVHGCAKMPPTLLVTSEHLAQPPLWAESALAERLRSSQVVFVGIGDIADYTRRRITELVEELRPPDVRIVSPGIEAGWDESAWKEVLPDLEEERRLAQTADTFLDELGRAWARQLAQTLEAEKASLAGASQEGVDSVLAALNEMDATTLMRWCRAIPVYPESGKSAVRLDSVGDAVLAAAVLAGDGGSVSTPHPGGCSVDGRPVELMACNGRVPATEVQRAAVRRSERLMASGLPPSAETRFLVGGTVTGRLDQPGALRNIAGGDEDPADIKDGPSSVAPTFLQATHVLAEAA